MQQIVDIQTQTIQMCIDELKATPKTKVAREALQKIKTTYELEAENQGYRTDMPKTDQVFIACVVSIVLMAVFAAWVEFGGAS